MYWKWIWWQFDAVIDYENLNISSQIKALEEFLNYRDWHEYEPRLKLLGFGANPDE